MEELTIHLTGDGCWPDLSEEELQQVLRLESVARLVGAMESGRSAVLLRIATPDGGAVVAYTSMRLFLDAANAFAAVELREGAQ